jgi:hypothetical protein
VTEPILAVPVVVAPWWLTVKEWAVNSVERAARSMLAGVAALFGTAALTGFNADSGKKIATAALIALASFVVHTALPKSGFGLPPMLDVLARAAWSAVQAGAVVVTANAYLDWFTITPWEMVDAAALAAGTSVIVGWIATRFAPDQTITPASFVKVSDAR